jgi:acyl carrier protein
MKRPSEELVRSTIAEHLEVDANTIRPDQNLERDLGITPLGIVLVVLALEDLEGVLFSFDQMTAVKTVSDLSNFLAEARIAEQGRVYTRHVG